jgi:hypothetical protein
MTNLQWDYYIDFCDRFKRKICEWNEHAKILMNVQSAAIDFFENAKYELQTPIVYNTALDEITKNDDIKLIVIGDNPGKDEQLLQNQKYLVGQAGKLGNNFFAKNSELQIDFRKNVIILNKTPIHSAKTNHLKRFSSFDKTNSALIEDLLKETQLWMAKETALLHKNLLNESKSKDFPQLWLVGYSELKEKGIFTEYKNALKNEYLENGKFEESWENVFVFQHFSMNRFSIDLNNYKKENENLQLKECLKKLGKNHKEEIFIN